MFFEVFPMHRSRPPGRYIIGFITLAVAVATLPACDRSADRTALPAAMSPQHVAKRFELAVSVIDSYEGDSATLERGKAILEEILAADPNHAPAHREMARIHIKDSHVTSGRHRVAGMKAAEASLENALRIDPEFAEAHVLAGHMYLIMRRQAEARAALTKAEQLGTSDPWLHNNWADLLLAEGKLEEAAQRYQKVLDSGTDNLNAMTGALAGLTDYFVATGRLDEADSAYQRTIELQPDSAWNRGNYAGFLLCRRDRPDQAISQARDALKIMGYGVGRHTLAAALYRKWSVRKSEGKLAEADESLEEARSLVPGDPVEVVSTVCGEDNVADAMLKLAKQGTLRPEVSL